MKINEDIIKRSGLSTSAIIFFVLFFALCPITNIHSAGKSVKDSESKKNETINDNGNKNAVSAREDDTLYEYEKPSVEEESYTWLVVKTLIVLGALIGGFYYFFRFVTKKTGIQTLGRDVIKILSVVPVGQNKFLQVVDLAGKVMVIGVSDSSINLITEIKDKDEIDRIRLMSSKSSPVQPGGFQDYISKYISKIFGKDNRDKSAGMKYDMSYDTSQEPEVDRLKYLKKQRERLKKINGNDNEI